MNHPLDVEKKEFWILKKFCVRLKTWSDSEKRWEFGHSPPSISSNVIYRTEANKQLVACHLFIRKENDGDDAFSFVSDFCVVEMYSKALNYFRSMRPRSLDISASSHHPQSSHTRTWRSLSLYDLFLLLFFFFCLIAFSRSLLPTTLALSFAVGCRCVYA